MQSGGEYVIQRQAYSLEASIQAQGYRDRAKPWKSKTEKYKEEHKWKYLFIYLPDF